jgi:hypothetical protein
VIIICAVPAPSQLKKGDELFAEKTDNEKPHRCLSYYAERDQ